MADLSIHGKIVRLASRHSPLLHPTEGVDDVRAERRVDLRGRELSDTVSVLGPVCVVTNHLTLQWLTNYQDETESTYIIFV